MKNKKINSEKVKAILKKSFDVFCYVVTALAITLGIAVGVNKCSSSAATESVAADLTKLSQPSNSTVIAKRAVNVEDSYVYISKFMGEMNVTTAPIREYYQVPSTTSAVQRERRVFRLDFDEPIVAYRVYSGNYFNISSMYLRFDDMPVNESTPSVYTYMLYSTWFESTDGEGMALYVKSNSYATDYTGTYYAFRVVISSYQEERTPFTFFFSESEKSTFTFNESFNYNAPFNLNVNAVYGSTSFDGGGQNMNYKDYDVGWFYSNGQFFNRIRWWAISASRGVAVMIGGNVSVLSSETDWVYTTMYYVNTDTGNEVLVNQRDSIPYDGGNSRYYANSTTWIVPSYRKIVFLTELSNTLRDSLESFNNNNQTTYGGGVVTSEVNDVFSLIASAFSGLLPILTLAILPNITIGTLLFVPLVAMLVFAIIRIIKK